MPLKSTHDIASRRKIAQLDIQKQEEKIRQNKQQTNKLNQDLQQK
jgi:hypothetical protein